MILRRKTENYQYGKILFLLLLKLRQNLPYEKIARLYSHIFITWVKLPRKVVKPLIIWPSRQAFKQDIQSCVKRIASKMNCNYDCTVISMKRPRLLNKQVLTWCDYITQNTGMLRWDSTYPSGLVGRSILGLSKVANFSTFIYPVIRLWLMPD